MNLKAAVDQAYTELEDADQTIWPDRSEIENYMRRGYDKLVEATMCIWDIVYAENLPYAGDHNCLFEELTVQEAFQGQFNFTGNEWERDYQPNGIGPANFTQPWEMDDGGPNAGTFWNSLSTGSIVGQDFILATSKVTTRLLQIDRVTHDSYRVLPAFTARIRRFDGRYKFTQGPTHGYTFEDDGMYTFRKVPVPAARATYYYYAVSANMPTVASLYGTLRSANNNELGTSQTVNGSRGVMRICNLHFPANIRRGTPRRLYSDVKNVRVEVYRKGNDLRNYEFEIPDRYIRYVIHYVKHKALEREGTGQDLKLSKHFGDRFAQGVERLKNRTQMTLRARVGQLGAGGQTMSKPPLVRMPWPYPRVQW
jgi:hypothetical protein